MFDTINATGDRALTHATVPDAVNLRPLSLVRTLLIRLRHEIWLRNQVTKALALDDRILADIAMSRREIKHAVRGDVSVLEKRVQEQAG